MIKRIRIANFRSLRDVTVDLEPITVLIGRSGTGKSNFLDAIRFLRDCIRTRNPDAVAGGYEGWTRARSATQSYPQSLLFDTVFTGRGVKGDYQYRLKIGASSPSHSAVVEEELLTLGDQTLFHHDNLRWLHQPPLVTVRDPRGIMLGSMTGFLESTTACLLLTTGVGCYSFSDDVLTNPERLASGTLIGLADDAANYLNAFAALGTSLDGLRAVREMVGSLRVLKPSLKSLDVQLPGWEKVVTTHDVGGKLLDLTLSQESEGFRRLMACLLALYQSPPKQTLLFDEPEKGIYPAGLPLLSDEFKTFASKRGGQVILTTHSPKFLDEFAPEQVRVVEMRDYETRIGPISPEQLEALRDRTLYMSELLTVDKARLETATAG